MTGWHRCFDGRYLRMKDVQMIWETLPDYDGLRQVNVQMSGGAHVTVTRHKTSEACKKTIRALMKKAEAKDPDQ